MRRSLPKILIRTGTRRALGMLEEQRRAARLRHAVGDLRDFQNRIHFRGDALQLAFAFQPRKKVRKSR